MPVPVGTLPIEALMQVERAILLYYMVALLAVLAPEQPLAHPSLQPGDLPLMDQKALFDLCWGLNSQLHRPSLS